MESSRDHAIDELRGDQCEMQVQLVAIQHSIHAVSRPFDFRHVGGCDWFRPEGPQNALVISRLSGNQDKN